MRAFQVIILALACVACGGVDDHPLGGPYGGTTNAPRPGSGNSFGTATTDEGTTDVPDSGTSSSSSSSSSSGSSGAPADAPTWSQVWTSYLKSGTIGNCPHCHSSTGSPSGAYGWLKNKGALSPLTDGHRSCLTWFGGNMPPSGPKSASAVKDMNAWAAAGAPNN